MRINIINSPFSHSISSTWYKKSSHIEWDYGSLSNFITFYVDGLSVLRGIENKNDGKLKFLWGLESPEINNNFIDIVKNNLEEVLDTYELIFTYSDELLSLDSKFVFCPANGFWINHPKINKKNKLISMITSNKTLTNLQRYRVDFAKKNNQKMDLFGNGFRKINIKEDGLNEYMFSVCIENSEHNTYFTEKILDCFATGTIPIYKGTKNIINHYNREGILFLDDTNLDELTPELYYSKIDQIRDNFERVLPFYVLEDWIYENYIKNY